LGRPPLFEINFLKFHLYHIAIYSYVIYLFISLTQTQTYFYTIVSSIYSLVKHLYISHVCFFFCNCFDPIILYIFKFCLWMLPLYIWLLMFLLWKMFRAVSTMWVVSRPDEYWVKENKKRQCFTLFTLPSAPTNTMAWKLGKMFSDGASCFQSKS
jgi:hypothetical protein